FTKVGEVATVKYVPSPVLAQQSKHTVTLTYPDAAGAPKTLAWNFTVAVFTLDRVQSRLGSFRFNATYSENTGGRTSKNGDYSLNLTRAGGEVLINDASFLNAATVNDEL